MGRYGFYNANAYYMYTCTCTYCYCIEGSITIGEFVAVLRLIEFELVLRFCNLLVCP